jgi:hypothetical protein
MEGSKTEMPGIFLDTSYAIALSNARDRLHVKACDVAATLRQSGTHLITTRSVLIEVGNALAKAKFRSAAVSLLHSIESDPRIEIVPFSDDLYLRSLALFSARSDKEWGLSDCISFTVMKDRGVEEVLTADEHFRQAGFRPLLIES